MERIFDGARRSDSRFAVIGRRIQTQIPPENLIARLLEF